MPLKVSWNNSWIKMARLSSHVERYVEPTPWGMIRVHTGNDDYLFKIHVFFHVIIRLPAKRLCTSVHMFWFCRQKVEFQIFENWRYEFSMFPVISIQIVDLEYTYITYSMYKRFVVILFELNENFERHVTCKNRWFCIASLLDIRML